MCCLRTCGRCRALAQTPAFQARAANLNGGTFKFAAPPPRATARNRRPRDRTAQDGRRPFRQIPVSLDRIFSTNATERTRPSPSSISGSSIFRRGCLVNASHGVPCPLGHMIKELFTNFTLNLDISRQFGPVVNYFVKHLPVEGGKILLLTTNRRLELLKVKRRGGTRSERGGGRGERRRAP